MQGGQGIRQTRLPGHDGGVTAGGPEAHRRLPAGNRDGDDQLLLGHQMPDETDLAPDARLFQDRLQRINQRPARKGPQVCGQRQGRHRPRAGRRWHEPWQPSMDQEKDADGKDEHEGRAEQPQVQVQIPHQPVEPPSHAAGFPFAGEIASGRRREHTLPGKPIAWQCRIAFRWTALVKDRLRVVCLLQILRDGVLPFAERFEHMPAMRPQLVAVSRQQAGPGVILGHGAGLVERRPRLFIRNLEEQQKRQLLHIIAAGQTVIAQDVAVVPEFLDERGRCAHD